jgi:hypothetical protein
MRCENSVDGERISMNSEGSSHKSRENFVSAFSAGAFLVLLGAIFVSTPDFFARVVDFFTDFKAFVEVPHFAGVFLPMPEHLRSHTAVYSAAMQFCLAWGIFLVGLLVMRIFAGSPLRKKAENASDIVFWLLTSFLIMNFLNDSTTREMWFAFWAALITILGVSLIVRAIILALFK